MTSYARREVVTHQIQYGFKLGSDVGTLHRVLNIAYADYLRRNNIPASAMETDDWAQISADDDNVTITFTVQKTTDPTEPGPSMADMLRAEIDRVIIQRKDEPDEPLNQHWVFGARWAEAFVEQKERY